MIDAPSIDGVEYDAAPGDSWCIGSDVFHSVRVVEGSVAVEMFSPVREDYLD
jgi:quercetin dioxygenase-like cupin family protein